MTVFHDLCRDLQEINQRIYRLRTIWLFANDLLSCHKREDFITTTQTAFSTILGQVFTQDRIDRAAVSPTTLADLAPASHTSSTSVCRFLASANHTISIKIPRSSPDLFFFFCAYDIVGENSENSCSRKQLRWAGSWVGARGFPADPPRK